MTTTPAADQPRRFPCLPTGTNAYRGCVGAAACRSRFHTPRCLFGRWPSDAPRRTWDDASLVQLAGRAGRLN